MDTLALAPSPPGEREFLDFVVNGRPFFELLGGYENKSDLVTIFRAHGRWLTADANAEYRAMFEGRADRQHPSGRVPLYVCPMDADLQCGVVAARIRITTDTVVWSGFAWDDGWPLGEVEELQELGPFEFERVAYMALIESAFTGGPN
jgi:hypothetical protein